MLTPFLHDTLFFLFWIFVLAWCQQSKPEKLHGGGVPGAFALNEKKHLGLKVHSQKPKNVQKKSKPDFKKWWFGVWRGLVCKHECTSASQKATEVERPLCALKEGLKHAAAVPLISINYQKSCDSKTPGSA